MSGPKFSNRQRLEVLAKVSDFWTKGYTAVQIAAEIGVSSRQVESYIRKLKDQWIARNEQAVADHRAELIAQSTRVKQEAWRGWEKSLTDAEKTKIGMSGDKPVDITETIMGQAGDPRFLQVIQKSLEFESDMVQATPPKKIAPTTPEGDALPIKIYTGIDLDKV